MAIKLTYAKILDDIQPALVAISGLGFPMKVPISHHVTIAENMEAAESTAKIFWAARKTLLENFCEKDKKGEVKTKDVDGQQTYMFKGTGKKDYEKKFEELREEEVEIDFKFIKKSHFEGVKDIKPAMIKGILKILED